MTDQPKTTFRMTRYADDSTLNGYIFTDRAHAHLWLAQQFVDRAKIRLDEVQVGPMVGCPRCGGTGHRQDVKVIRKLTPDEVQNV